ncbi:MAG: hypothetical protein M3N98_06025 [Actinomycetota bacterium]|nr:hypothetical protein [Actinomycetota bacterium]
MKSLDLPPAGPKRAPVRSALGVMGVTLGIAACGWELATGSLLILLAGLALLIAVMQFRRGVAGLETVMVTMPFIGLLSIAVYPRSFLGLAGRDILLVMPLLAYVCLRRLEDRTPLPSSFPWRWLFAFVAIVVAQVFNPDGGPILIRLIGAKTWLFYIPLMLCAYDYCSSRQRVHRLVKLVCLAGIPSIVIGLWEAFEIKSGHALQVYAYYGNAASAVSQSFAQLQVSGGGVIRRVPSTFTFGAQYYLFTLVMLTSSTVWLRLSAHRRERMFAAGLTLLVCLAAVTSGVREALFGVPAFFLFDFLFSGRRHVAALVKLVGSSVTGVVALAAVAGSTAVALIAHLGSSAIIEYNIVLVQGFSGAFRMTLFGLGVGVDTNAARYALPNHSAAQTFFAQGFESWYVKTQLELGVIGLVIMACFLAAVVSRLRLVVRATSDPALASAGAALLALVVSILVQNLKGQYLDLDPMSLFFWVAIGVILRLPTLAAEHGQ